MTNHPNPILGRKHINRLAIPALLAGVTEPVLSLTDTAIVGHIPEQGLAALAAVGIVGSFLAMLVWILGQTSSALSAVVSQYYGANKLYQINPLPGQAIAVNLLIGIFLLLISLPFSDSIFGMLNASGDVMQLCMEYYAIRAWGFPLTLIIFGVMGVFQGLQNTTWPMAVAITGAALNIVLDVLLVYGVPGWIPALGLEGAAWASLIAQGVMVVLALFLIHRYTHIKIIPSFSWHPELGRVLGMAGNLFIRSLALNIALLFAVRQAAGLGASAIGAHTIAINLWLFAAFFIDGYAVAGKILAGRFIGAHDIPSLWQLSQKILFYGLGVTALLIVFGVIFYTQIGLQFSSDKAVLSDFGTLFKWVLIGLPICSVAFIFDGIFKGLGKTQLLRNLLVLTTTLGYLPSLFLGQYMEWGLIGIWGALTFWMALRGGVLVWKFHQYFHPLLQKT